MYGQPVVPRSQRTSGSLASTMCAVLVSMVVLGACNSDDSADGPTVPTISASSTTTTDAPGTPAPPTPPQAAGATADSLRTAFVLTRLEVDIPRATALATRANDPAMYVAGQDGKIFVIRDGTLLSKPLLDISKLVSNDPEQGLLGIVFSPDGARLYVNYTDTAGDTRVVEYQINNTGVVDPATARTLLEVEQPQANHNGGQLAFGPDALLYIGLGDGGGANDRGSGHVAGGNGQSLETLLGKILRINPEPTASSPYTIPADNPFAKGGGRPEIWSYGLRNPWRFSFDRETGDLWASDVGQDKWEEINLSPGATSRGANYGWPALEGSHRIAGDAPKGAVGPIYEYSHRATNGCSITGGYVYRGTRIPAMRGWYLFSDFCHGKIEAIRVVNGTVERASALPHTVDSPGSFGEDGSGELYVLSQTGAIFRFDPA